MKRKDAMRHIVANVAKDGMVSGETVRIYVENNISAQVFQDCVIRGLAIERKIQEDVDRLEAGRVAT